MTKFEIVAGPSKFDLMTALFDRKGNGGKPHCVVFKTKCGYSHHVYIGSVTADDSSGESWLIQGRVISTATATSTTYQGFAFRGWYSTSGRGGRIEEIPRMDNSDIAASLEFNA